jgi:signal transduction histidine kinase
VFLSQRTRQYAAAQITLAQELASRFALALEAAHMYQACKLALEDSRESLATTIHDLMSPLTYIKGTAQRLQRFKKTLADPSTTSDLYIRLEAIDAAANRMASALNALLQTTRLEPVDWPQRHGLRTDLVALARRVVAVEQLMARQHSICLREAPPALEGTWRTERLEHMLANLIGNAVKYSPPGSCVDISLTADLDEEGRWAVVRVSDRGVGIPAGDLPFVFEPFRRGSNVGEVVGSGLGLASVWQTVKTYDGRLSVDSQEGVGTCVMVRLPLPDGTVTSSTSTLD